MTGTLRSILRRGREADGFTLIEVIVALSIATVVFSAMAAAGLAGVKASVVARQNQQAVDVLNRLVEEARGVNFATLAMVTSDLQVGDNAITGSPPRYTVANGIGPENVWADATGAVNPHVETVSSSTTADAVDYTTKTYVTLPAGTTLDNSDQPYQKRLTIVATWTAYGSTHERTISTLLTETTRGLPLPRYAVIPTSPTTASKAPGATLTWGFQVINRGARDAFNISASTGTWTYYVDDDCNGALDAGEATTLTNTDAALGDSRPDTGKLEPNNNPPFCVVAQRAIPLTELGVSTVTFNLQSSAQPLAEGAAVGVGPYTVTVTNGSTGGSATPTPSGTSTVVPPTTICEPTPAGAGTPFGFRNGTTATYGDTTSQLVNSMTENTCLNQASSADYSTDQGGGTGRSLTTGGTVTTSTAAQLAEWRWASASTRTVAAGTATISVMVLCPVTGALTLNGAIGTWETQGQGAWVQKGSGSATGFCATSNTWTRVTVPMSVSSAFTVNPKVGPTKELQLSTRLWVTGGSAGQTIRLDYEQPNAKSFLYVSVA
ncbi:MAG: prepilin-type N-terminal cleavage/methylation domain-containing protein [Actinomycetes bacterium]